jgi:hypothetical protein
MITHSIAKNHAIAEAGSLARPSIQKKWRRGVPHAAARPPQKLKGSDFLHNPEERLADEFFRHQNRF